jgi:hypothetical protein
MVPLLVCFEEKDEDEVWEPHPDYLTRPYFVEAMAFLFSPILH